MNAKVVLHIGRHKTGTTSIQKFLHANSDELKSYGLYYPKNTYPNKFAHHDLVKDISRYDYRLSPFALSAYRSRPLLVPFFNELSKKHINIVSLSLIHI